MGNRNPDPNRVGHSQMPLNFVDGNGYMVLRGVVEAGDCDVGWGKVVKAWGSGDEKIVAKNYELLFNAERSEDQARDLDLPPALAKQKLAGEGGRGPLFKKFHPPLRGKCL